MILQLKKSEIMSCKAQLLCRKCSLLFILLLVFQVGFAQYQFDKVDTWMKENVDALGGRAVVVIYKDGQLVYNHAENDLKPRQKFAGKRIARQQGKDEEEVLQDFDSHTKIPIASCSKWLTAALMMTFVDDGSVSLEDSVGKFLPVMTAGGKGNIKIWQCLSHLTGIKPAPFMEGLQLILKSRTMDEAVEKIAAEEMEGEPGVTFHYGNEGLQLAAAIVEKVGGKSFHELFKERITQPCEMPDTDFGDGAVPLAAGGARSTANDYLHFLMMILNNGSYNGHQVLSEKSVAAMQVNRITPDCKIPYTPAETTGWGYGFGEWVAPICNPLAKQPWACAEQGTRSFFAASPGLFGSFPWVDNDRHYAAFLLTFGFKSKGRSDRYHALKTLIDQAVQ